MSLLEKIKQERIQAMLDKDKAKSSALTVFLGELSRKNVKVVDDKDVITALRTYTGNIKKQFAAMPYMRTDDAVRELEILEKFLPQSLTPEMIANIMQEQKFETLSEAMKYFSMYEIKHGVLVDKATVKEMWVD